MEEKLVLVQIAGSTFLMILCQLAMWGENSRAAKERLGQFWAVVQ